MINKIGAFHVLVVVLSITAVAYCAEETNRNQDRRGTEIMAIGNNEHVVVRAQCIRTTKGSAVGFRVEVINPSTDKNLVLVMRDNISVLFDARLINEQGQDISPMPSKMAADKQESDRPKAYRYEVVSSLTSHAWFIPVPEQVRADSAKPTNSNNLKTTPSVKYTAVIRVNVSYFVQDKGVELISESPDFRPLQLSLPGIPIVIDQDSFDHDIFKTYLENKEE